MLQKEPRQRNIEEGARMLKKVIDEAYRRDANGANRSMSLYELTTSTTTTRGIPLQVLPLTHGSTE